MSGSEVAALQTALTKAGFAVETIGRYDENTAAAVSGFQMKYKNEVLTSLGLANPTGYFGPSTRAAMNRLYGCDRDNRVVDRTPSPTSASLTVTWPTVNSSFVNTFARQIAWTTTNVSATNNINIALLTSNGANAAGWNFLQTPNDGQENVNLSNVAPGFYYFLMSTVINGQTISGRSGVF